MSKGATPRQDFLPIGPFRALMLEWIERKRATHTDPYTVLGELLWPGSDPKITTRRLSTILEEQEYLSFDTADHILCRIGESHRWYSDPELRELYENANLIVADVNYPTCDAAAEQTQQLILESYGRHKSQRGVRAELGIGWVQVRRAIEAGACA